MFRGEVTTLSPSPPLFTAAGGCQDAWKYSGRCTVLLEREVTPYSWTCSSSSSLSFSPLKVSTYRKPAGGGGGDRRTCKVVCSVGETDPHGEPEMDEC